MAKGVVRRSRRQQPEILWPTPDPLTLGAQVTLRYRAPRWWGGDGSPRRLEASLRCVETVPPAQTNLSVDEFCAVRVVGVRPWFEAEVDVRVPLEAIPTSQLAGHRVTWRLDLCDSAAPPGSEVLEWPVLVAPAVARAVLQGDVTP